MGPASASAAREGVLAAFNDFRVQIDDYNDRRERLIKISRDITIHSKRLIFLLHRIANDDALDAQQRAAECRQKLKPIRAFFEAASDELRGQDFGRYSQSLSPGVQEYIEAISFSHYLEHGTLITHAQAQALISTPAGEPWFPLTHSDYLLGISDLTGELMRLAITSSGLRQGRHKAAEVCDFVRRCTADFESLTPYVNELSKKQSVTTESLKKIELAAYGIAIRGSEYHDFPRSFDDDPGHGRPADEAY
ncbi:hypothetical protein BOTBODRAFT_26582 [Botryobasidium botryosum FD-172 SS1]|uniref:Translin n=1 Tax=Botryobasidium botryosum (strain FD-172 SS1) TaxID=930990 RepID=A0A067N9V6_BOTB1|nr:hypothetical protein BOTBODRAFT_26582 [Botryobasidium botryosum FD-172 SS1]